MSAAVFGPQMLGSLAASTHVDSRMPIYVGIVECSACPDFHYTSRDVTSCGDAYLKHWTAAHASAVSA